MNKNILFPMEKGNCLYYAKVYTEGVVACLPTCFAFCRDNLSNVAQGDYHLYQISVKNIISLCTCIGTCACMCISVWVYVSCIYVYGHVCMCTFEEK